MAFTERVASAGASSARRSGVAEPDPLAGGQLSSASSAFSPIPRLGVFRTRRTETMSSSLASARR